MEDQSKLGFMGKYGKFIHGLVFISLRVLEGAARS